MNFNEMTSVSNAQLAMIKRHCGNVIAAVRQARSTSRPYPFLYRSGNKTQGLLGITINDRKPLHTPVSQHMQADNFMKELGLKATRSNSIFVIASKNRSTMYGDHTYIIFPKDSCDYTWSRKYPDFFSVVMSYGHLVPHLHKDEQLRISSAEEFQKIMQYDTTDMVGAIRAQHEIMIKGSYYKILVNNEDSDVEKYIGTKLGIL